MMGNYHVRFLGGWGAVMPPGYPALAIIPSIFRIRTGHMPTDGCNYEGCSVDNEEQSLKIVIENLISNPKDWDFTARRI